jgi:hypothetical protein
MAQAEPASPASPVVKTESKRPEDTAFKQQRLPAWQPVMSPKLVIGCFLILGPIFIAIGVAIIVASDSVVEIEIRYDHKQPCPFSARLPSSNWACPTLSVEFQIPQTMKAPIFIYYKLEDFYQNHFRYAKSVSDTQLSGGTIDGSVKDCSPMMYIGEYVNLNPIPAWNSSVYFVNQTTPFDLRNVMYNPCGLIAWSMFNDTISLWKKSTTASAFGNASVPICQGGAFDTASNPLVAQNCEKKGIAWPSDPGVRYTQPADQGTSTLTYRGWRNIIVPPSSSPAAPWALHARNGWYIGEEGHQIPNPSDEDFMVWMRLASLSTFRKLYRRITTDLDPGLYELRIDQRFDLRAFQGKKSVVLATGSWIGGKNYFLAGMYIAVGSLCLILGAGFFAKYWRTPRRIGSL